MSKCIFDWLRLLKFSRFYRFFNKSRPWLKTNRIVKFHIIQIVSFLDCIYLLNEFYLLWGPNIAALLKYFSIVFQRSMRLSFLNPPLELSNEKVVLILFFVNEKHIATWTIDLILTLKIRKGFLDGHNEWELRRKKECPIKSASHDSWLTFLTCIWGYWILYFFEGKLGANSLGTNFWMFQAWHFKIPLLFGWYFYKDLSNC